MRAALVTAVLLVFLPLTPAAAAPSSTGPAVQGGDRGHAASVGDAYSVIGHRGNGTDVHTENTLASLQSAAAAGATAVEIDVRVTADDRLVVVHDAGLGRTTTCSGPVRARTLTWIQDNCRGRRGAEPVPSLVQVLDWAGATGISLLIELKEAPGWTADRIQEIADAISERHLETTAQLLSFSTALLDLAEAAGPALHTQLIISGTRRPDLAVGRYDGVNVDPAEATPALVTRLHGFGMTVYGRTSNHPAEWRRYWTAGVDGFLTDRPGAARDSLAAFRADPGGDVR